MKREPRCEFDRTKLVNGGTVELPADKHEEVVRQTAIADDECRVNPVSFNERCPGETVPDNHYVNFRLAEIYDVDSGWSIDRDFYLALAGSQRQNILDLGCGTGLLCNAYAANGHDVTGVDPAPAMLDLGRRKPYGSNIEWVQSSAQNYRSDKRFDLIIMTGHAFQVLLEDDDVLQTFFTMRKHLKPGGSVAFESRNPSVDWKQEWNYDMVLELPASSVHESRRFLAMDNDRMSFELRYRFPDETLVSLSKLRFLSRNDIEERLTAAGLCIEQVMGDWDGTAFDESSSKEMIFIVRAASEIVPNAPQY